jgi:hypothetical protein
MSQPTTAWQCDRLTLVTIAYTCDMCGLVRNTEYDHESFVQKMLDL